LNKLEA
jgi:hypothetical protein